MKCLSHHKPSSIRTTISCPRMIKNSLHFTNKSLVKSSMNVRKKILCATSWKIQQTESLRQLKVIKRIRRWWCVQKLSHGKLERPKNNSSEAFLLRRPRHLLFDARLQWFKHQCSIERHLQHHRNKNLNKKKNSFQASLNMVLNNNKGRQVVINYFAAA